MEQLQEGSMRDTHLRMSSSLVALEVTEMLDSDR